MKFIIIICMVVSCYLYKRCFEIIPFSIHFSPKEVQATQDNTLNVFDPLSMYSEVELRLLESLEKRRKDLERKEKDFQKKETNFVFYDQEIQKKIKQLMDLKKFLEQSLTKIDKEDEQKIQNFAKICQNMKPANAAKILDQLESDELERLVSFMDIRRVSAILAKMNPSKSKNLVKNIVSKRNPFLK